MLVNPGKTIDHGRPIYYDSAKKCGLKVRCMDNKDSVWRVVWELYLRLDHLTSSTIAKVIESAEESFTAPVS